MSGKALSLLKEAVPALRRVAVLWNAATRSSLISLELGSIQNSLLMLAAASWEQAAIRAERATRGTDA
jgi:hypothetical protein